MMAERKYYLLYLDELGMVKPLGKAYPDITDIDLMTLENTKESFLQKYLPNQKIKDLFIGRLTYNSKTNVYDFHFYECFFESEHSSRITEKIQESMKRFALERQQKIKSPNKIELDSNATAFQEYTNFLIEQITSNRDTLMRFTNDINITNPNLKKIILQYQKDNYSLRSLIWKHLKQYKELRMASYVYLSYLNQEKLDCAKNNHQRENYEYSSLLFDFYYEFPIYYHEASEIKEKDFLPLRYQQRNQVVQKLKQEPFDSQELNEMYQMGGIPYILEHMDTNELYSSSKEDLLRLGFINEEDYWQHKK